MSLTLMVLRKFYSSLFFLLLFNCKSYQKDDFKQLRGYALGTTYSISYSSSKLNKNLLSHKIDSIIKIINASMSTYDNLLAVVQLNEKKHDKQRLKVEQLLNEFNLQHLRKINANLLSGGEVRRLQIARTLVNNPKVILLDEPMAALDPIVVQDIQKYILKLQSYGTGVIVTDHNIQNLLQVVDKCIVIGEQTIIAEGKPKEILQSAKARELYFGSYE